MIKLTLKDGSVREIENAQPAAEIVKGIGMGLYKAACCVKVNGEVKDLRTVIDSDCEFEVCTFDVLDGKKTFWHTASHILAQAVKRLYPSAKLAIGPAIDNGFYYDFDLEKPFSEYSLHDLVWTRPNFERPYSWDWVTIVGHTPTQLIPQNDEPGWIYRKNNIIDIDCGVHTVGGRLAAFCLETEEAVYVRNV